MAVAELNLSRRALLAAALATPVACAASPRNDGAALSPGQRDWGPIMGSSQTLQGKLGSGSSPEHEQGEEGEEAQSFVVTKSAHVSSLPDRPEPGRRTAPWNRALARFRRAEAVLAAATAGHADDDLFGRLLGRFNAALRRLLRAPAPDLAALALKLGLAAREAAWELTGAETCIAALAREARRLARA